MPRISRNLMGSAFIHNMVQGINKENIFQSENQKNKYLKLIRKYSEKYEILIIAYCIMDNHAHLLTYSDNIQSISLCMKETNTEYAIYYNKIKDRVGYVFRNRFNSKPIYNQEYLLKCIKYIHMNPVKAGIVRKEEDYEFSSYREYLNKGKIINSKLLEIVFNQEKNYLEKLNSIEYTPLNLEKEKIKLEEVLEEFLSNNKITLIQVQKDTILIKKFISYLILKEYEFKKQELAKVLKISRSKLYRKLKGRTANDNI